MNADRKICWLHNDYSQIGCDRQLDNYYYAQVDKVVTISKICADTWRTAFPQLLDKIVVLPNLTSSEIIRRLSRESVPKEYIPEKEKKTILVSIGRLHPQKGFDLAIQAASLMKRRNHLAFHWYILGSGELKEDLERQCAAAHVEDCLEFIGSRENPYPYLRYAHIVVQPSRFEGKSIVLDESKILAKPIVATNYPTVGDQLKPDEGIVVDMTPEAIAEGIEHMVGVMDTYSRTLSKREYGNVREIVKYDDLFSGSKEYES